MLQDTLQSFGYEVVEASDGKEALEKYSRESFGIVICDWAVPGMNALALCNAVRSTPRDEYTYFILIAGMPADDKKKYAEALAQGVDDFVTKPLDPSALQIRLCVAERMLSLNAWVRKLEGIFSICTYCRRIHNEQGDYEPIERYVQRHTGAVFSTGSVRSVLKVIFPTSPSNMARPWKKTNSVRE